MSKIEAVSTPEILSAILSNSVGSNVAALKADAAGFIQDKTGVALSSDIKVVENNDSTVNLALPYYDVVGTHKVASLDESEMDAASGGNLIALAAGSAAAAVVQNEEFLEGSQRFADYTGDGISRTMDENAANK